MSFPGSEANGFSQGWEQLARKYKKRAILIAIMSAATGLISTIFFVTIQRLAAGQFALTASIVVALFVLYILTTGLGILAIQLTLRASSSFAAELRYMLAERVLQSPLRSIEKQGLGRITGNILEDVNLLTTLVEAIPMIAQNVVIVTCIMMYLLWADWQLGLTVILFSSLAGIVSVVAGRRFQTKVREIWRQGTILRDLATHLVVGIKELKLSPERQSKFLKDNYASALWAHRNKAVDGASSLAILQSVFRGASLLGILLVVCYSAVAGHQTVNVQGLLILLYGIGPMGYVLGAASNWAQLGRTYAGILRLAEDLGEREILSLEFERYDRWRVVEIRDVVFEYQGAGSGDDGFRVGPLSLSLAPAKIFAVTGPNGAGKTTFAKTLAGLYEPSGGDFLLDGRAVNRSEIQEYRSQFSAIFLEYHLFDELLPGNNIGKDDLHAFLELIGMAGKVELNDLKLSRTQLSSGQRKRLALLEVFAQDRQIIILDEWAAEQDPLNRAIFYDKVLPLLRARGKCIILISHDKEALNVADVVISVQDGQIQARDVV